MKPLPKLGMMLITAASLGLYVGLAVWGWGGWSRSWHTRAGGRRRRDHRHLGRGDVHERQHLEWSARGHQESLDLAAHRGPRVRPGVAAGVHRPPRRLDESTATRCATLGWRFSSPAASLRLAPVFVLGRRFQRTGRDPGRTRARHGGPLPCDPPSELPWPAAGMFGWTCSSAAGSASCSRYSWCRRSSRA